MLPGCPRGGLGWIVLTSIQVPGHAQWVNPFSAELLETKLSTFDGLLA